MQSLTLVTKSTLVMAVGGAIAESKQRSGVAVYEAPDLPRVTWYKHKGLIKLYLVFFNFDYAD